MPNPSPSKLPWILTGASIAIAGIAGAAWVGGWAVPWTQIVDTSRFWTSKDRDAWAFACDSIRARLRHPSEASFPAMPKVKITPMDTGLSYSLLALNATQGQGHKAFGRDDEFYKWRQEMLNRAEFTQMNDGWLAAAWVDAPNAMGVRSRLGWIASVRYDDLGGAFEATKLQLIELDY